LDHGFYSWFIIFKQFNDRCESNSFAFVLSPTIEDGKKLSDDALIRNYSGSYYAIA